MSLESTSRSQFLLLKTSRFAPLFVTQFLGALNGNFFKSALVAMLTFQATQWTAFSPALMICVAAGVFILPCFLFSALAGQLADKYDKAKLARLLTALEILITGVTVLGFLMPGLPVLLGALFLLGLHSTLFEPLKYAILPQHLRKDELVGGNALVGASTFIAILGGMVAGGLFAWKVWQPGLMAVVGLLVAATGFLASCSIPTASAPDPGLQINLNPLSETWRNIRFARQNRAVFLSILGISWFWLCGAIFVSQFPVYATTVLGGGETSVAFLFATVAVGIGLGSMLCNKLSGKYVEVGLVPFGSIGLTIFGFDLVVASPGMLPTGAPLALTSLLSLHETWRILFDILALGVFGGFFIVPLYVLMLSRSQPGHRARIVAANNILNALFMVIGVLAAAGLLAGGMSIPMLFGIVVLCNAGVAAYIYRLAPHLLLRFLAWMLIHSVYRLEKEGLEHIPDEGPAVLVCNHVSFIDPVVLMAAIRRPIRFVMDHRIYRMPVIGFVFRHSRTIPIAPAKEDAAQKEAAFVEVARALGEGELIGLFPEGKITHTGELNHFRYGVGRIVAETPVPVIPMTLRGLWGSFFSRRYGPAMSKPSLLRLFSRIGLVAGEPVAPEIVTPDYLQELVAALVSDD